MTFAAASTFRPRRPSVRFWASATKLIVFTGIPLAKESGSNREQCRTKEYPEEAECECAAQHTEKDKK